jgi:hypothetical protein
MKTLKVSLFPLFVCQSQSYHQWLLASVAHFSFYNYTHLNILCDTRSYRLALCLFQWRRNLSLQLRPTFQSVTSYMTAPTQVQKERLTALTSPHISTARYAEPEHSRNIRQNSDKFIVLSLAIYRRRNTNSNRQPNNHII